MHKKTTKVQFFADKILKLENVLTYKLKEEEEYLDFNVAVKKILSYMERNGINQVGPFVQYTCVEQEKKAKDKAEITFMVQCDQYRKDVVSPFHMTPLLYVDDLMFCRYRGPERNMGIAYKQIRMYAEEEEIFMTGNSYTVFLEQDEKNIMVDVFMERALA